MKITTYINALQEAARQEMQLMDRFAITANEQYFYQSKRRERQSYKFASRIYGMYNNLEQEVEELYAYIETDC